MKNKLLWRGLAVSVPCAIAMACGASESESNPGTADASSTDASSDRTTSADGDTPSDANVTDSGTEAASLDAADAANATDATDADAGEASLGADASDASVSSDAALQQDVSIPDGGTPNGPTLLLSDTTANRIDLLTTTGAIIRQWTAPVTKVTGVSHDRRKRDGFWVIGRDSAAAFHKVSWAGAALGTVPNPTFAGTPVRGLDHWIDPDGGANGDVLAFVQFNGTVEALSGIYAADGGSQFQMGFFQTKFLTGFWGVSLLNYSEADNEMLGWFTHKSDGGTVERWRTASLQATIATTISDPRGLARGPAGDFWVVDGAAKKVVHLSAAGTVLGSFDTPGTDPAGLSFDPGP